MIKLEKLEEPEVLRRKGAEWTQVVRDKEARGERATPAETSRYRHPEIKRVLVRETNGKCAYCESKLLHIHHGDVEHIYPKSLDNTKMLEWGNLTLACERCNQNKSDKDPFLSHIIDPYGTDPEQHLLFVGPFVFDRGTVLGISTRSLIELDRIELVERRKEQLDRLMGVYSQVLRNDLPDAARRAIYQDLMERESAASAQFTAMNRAVAQQMEACVPEHVRRA